MPEAHVNSYYAATLNDTTRYPRLEGTVKADVAVVGGGFSGVATALTMAERGYRVALVEEHRVGWGASGRNGGQMIYGLSGESNLVRQLGEPGRHMLREIRYRGHDIIEERIARYGIECDLVRGWMEAAARSKHMAGIREHYEEMCASGHADHIELVERDGIRDVLGTDAYHGGFIDRRSGHLHPLNLCLGEARAAAGHGAMIFEESPATRIEGGAKPFVETAHGRIEAAHVVIGGGAGHPFQRGPLWGLTLPTGSYIICTAPIDEGLARRLNPQSLAVADSNVVLDYFRMTKDRRMLFGGRCNYTNRDPGDLGKTMKPRLVSVFPELRDVAVDYAWGGRIDIVITRIPAVGRLEPNVYYMQGYCGHGVNATHIAAEIVSDAICGTAEKLDLFEKIRHIPMPVGAAGNYLLALGMLYYRMKDML